MGNETLIKRNWLLGMRIQHEILKEHRAEYGEQVIKTLSKELTSKYVDGFSRNNLYRFISFFKSFPDMFYLAIGETEIVPSLTGQSAKYPTARFRPSRSKSPLVIYNIANPVCCKSLQMGC